MSEKTQSAPLPQSEKMFAFDTILRGETVRVEGWFSGNSPDDPIDFDIDAIWIGWSEANRGMPEHAGGPNPLDLSTLTDDEDEALTEDAFVAVAQHFGFDKATALKAAKGEAPPKQADGDCPTCAAHGKPHFGWCGWKYQANEVSP